MNEIRKSSQFKKDFKRIKNDITKVEALMRIVGFLERGEPIPSEHNPHICSKDKYKASWNVTLGRIFFYCGLMKIRI